MDASHQAALGDHRHARLDAVLRAEIDGDRLKVVARRLPDDARDHLAAAEVVVGVQLAESEQLRSRSFSDSASCSRRLSIVSVSTWALQVLVLRAQRGQIADSRRGSRR